MQTQEEARKIYIGLKQDRLKYFTTNEGNLIETDPEKIKEIDRELKELEEKYTDLGFSNNL